MKRLKFYGALLLLLVLISGRLFADFEFSDAIEEFGEKRSLRPLPEKIKAGPLRVHPTLRNRVTYDSNILLEDDDPREDVVFNILPGAILDLPIDQHRLSLGYEADFEIFSKSRDARQTDQNQNMFALADFHFSSAYVNILEQFSETSSRSGTTFTERIPRFDQSINPKIGYRWKRLIFESGFRHFVRDFRRQIDDRFDFQSVEFTEVVFYDLFARLKALVEYQFSQIDYDDGTARNGSFNQLRAGLEGEVYPHVLVKARFGPQFRNYRKSSEPDFYSWVADTRAEYEVRRNVKLTAGFSRSAIEATFADVNYYVRHDFRSGVEYEFRPKWTLFTDAGYHQDRYAERTTTIGQTRFRRDHGILSEAGLRYRPQDWMEVELAYQFNRRNSNIPELDYTDHQAVLSTALAY